MNTINTCHAYNLMSSSINNILDVLHVSVVHPMVDQNNQHPTATPSSCVASLNFNIIFVLFPPFWWVGHEWFSYHPPPPESNATLSHLPSSKGQLRLARSLPCLWLLWIPWLRQGHLWAKSLNRHEWWTSLAKFWGREKSVPGFCCETTLVRKRKKHEMIIKMSCLYTSYIHIYAKIPHVYTCIDVNVCTYMHTYSVYI